MADKKSVLVPLAPGFEEIEAVTIVDVLRRAGCEVVVAGLNDFAVEGAHGIRIEADTLISEVARDWDAVVLPGGIPGAEHLRDDDSVQEVLKSAASAGRLIAAVCAAPIALEKAGLLSGKKATSYPSFQSHLSSAEVSSDRVVVDGNVITSQGPGTALPFALAVAKYLVGEETATALQEGMLVQG